MNSRTLQCRLRLRLSGYFFGLFDAAEFFVHLSKGLLVEVINQAQADELKNCREEEGCGYQIAHINCNFPNLIAFVFANVAKGNHDDQYERGAKALCELSEEGVERVNGAFFTGAELPFVIVDSVAHHCPRNSGVDAKAEAVNELAEDVYDEVEAGVIGSDDEKSQSGNYRADRTKGCKLFLAVFSYHFTGQRCEAYDRDHRKELNDTRDLYVFEVGLEDNGYGGGCTLHTDKHTHCGDGCAYCGTVFNKVDESLENVELGCVFVKVDVGVNADLGVSDHKLEADEAQNAHDECCDEYAFTDKVVIAVVDDEGQNYHGKHIAEDGADGTPSRERSTVLNVIGDEGEERTVGYVCNGIESVPNNVACDEDYCLSPSRSVGEGQEAASAANDKSDGACPDICQKFVALIGVAVCVDNRTDKGVVNSIPNLNYDK